MCKRWRWLSVVVMWSVAMPGASASEPLAIVTQVHGSVRAAQGQLGLLDRVNAGDTVELGPGAGLVVFRTPQAQQFTLTGPGRFVVGAEGVTRHGGTGTVRMERRDPALAGALRPAGQVVAGAVVRSAAGAGDVEAIAPSRPVFSWRARPHRGQWQFRLTDEAGQVLYETSLAHTGLALPSTVRLLPDRRYRRELRWQGRDGALQVELASLQTLDAGADAQLASLLPPAGAPACDRVLFALYLRTLGVRSLAAQVAPEINDLDLSQ